jgi:hypothetical protein
MRISSNFAGLAMALTLSGCYQHNYEVYSPPTYNLLPVDETMTCESIASSFRFAAKRAARLEYWLEIGPIAGYGYERFMVDAPRQLLDERRRMDALSDLQRYKGCAVLEPGPAVVYERAKLEGISRQGPLPAPLPSVILKSRG